MISIRPYLVFFIFATTLSLGGPLRAQQEVIAGSVYDQDKESEVVMKARKRTYVGGRDESDLAVQSQLLAPIRKIAPQVESSGENGADE